MKVAAALCVAALLAGCSGIAGLKGVIPLGSTKPKPTATVAKASPAPRAAADGDDVVLAFAAPSRAAASGLDGLIARYAAHYGVPESLVHHVVKKESGYNPRARNGPYWGLMQIRHDTARSMGYRGDAAGLLDAETNLKYAVKYLRGAWIVGGRSETAAVRNYQRGYYYEAKRKGLLEESGLR